LRQSLVVQQAAKPLAALDLAFGMTNFFCRFNELVIKPLVISFAVIMPIRKILRLDP